jgi:iron complex transport system substrate-binding protein
MLYDLDADALARLKPDLILTQAQCDVCAVNEATVRRAAASVPGSPHVESVNPTDLAGVHAMFRLVGDLLNRRAEADAIIAAFEATAERISRRLDGRATRTVVLLEWLDPPFTSGHWNPELVGRAGGRDLLAEPGQPSRRASWDDVLRADPEVIVLAPCGYALDRSTVELGALRRRPGWSDIRAVQGGSVVLADGSAYFARPGPRLEESLRVAAAAVAPDACSDLAPTYGWRRIES